MQLKGKKAWKRLINEVFVMLYTVVVFFCWHNQSPFGFHVITQLENKEMTDYVNLYLKMSDNYYKLKLKHN